MLALGIHLCSFNNLIVLHNDEKILTTYKWESFELNKKDQSQVIKRQINLLLKSQSLELKQLTEIYYCSGPGAFTALRIVSSFCEALSIGLKIPLTSLPLKNIIQLAYPNKKVAIPLNQRFFYHKTTNESIDTNLDCLLVSDNNPKMQKTSEVELLLGTLKTQNWFNEDNFVSAYIQYSNKYIPQDIIYGIEPKIFGKRKT